MARHRQAIAAANWDPLWFLDGHPLRKELDKVMEECVMDRNNPVGQLVELSHRDFQSMVERFCIDNGSRFWGRHEREHLGAGAPVWPDNARSITMALRWVFQEAEERQRKKLIAEQRAHERADRRLGDQQAVTQVKEECPGPGSVDNAAVSAQSDDPPVGDELVSYVRPQKHLLDALETALNRTTTTSRRTKAGLKSGRHALLGNSGQRGNDTDLLLPKSEAMEGNRRNSKRNARSALDNSAALSGKDGDDGHGQAVLKKSKRLKTQGKPRDPEDGVMTMDEPQKSRPDERQQLNTTLQFFLTDRDLGAIPISLHRCMTPKEFFRQALTAWHGLEPDSSIPELVSVRFDWAPVPMVIKWKKKKGFWMLLKAVAAAPGWQQLDRQCHIEIRCIKRKA